MAVIVEIESTLKKTFKKIYGTSTGILVSYVYFKFQSHSKQLYFLISFFQANLTLVHIYQQNITINRILNE